MTRVARAISRRMTIGARLTFWYVFLLAVILVFFSGFLYILMAVSSFQSVQSILSSHNDQVRAQIEMENGSIKWPEPEVPSGTAAVFYDRTGNLVKAIGFAPGGSNYAKSWLERQMLRWMHTKSGTTSLITDSHGDTWLSLTAPIRDNNQTLGYLQTTRSLEPLEQTLQQLLLTFATLVPATLLIAVAIGMFLAKRALCPINRIVSAARAIGQGNLSQRLNWEGPRDELGRLAETFDEMIEKLEKVFDRQRQFTADASHELRTPITVIRAQAETALNGSRAQEEYRETLSQIVEESDRMGHLTRQLLVLARADTGREPLEKEPCELFELVQGVASEMQDSAKTKGIGLKANINPGIGSLTINGDQTWLTQLIINLVDNAIKYTPAAKVGYEPKVEVSLARQGEWAVLSVSDNGMGIPDADLPHIFQRFYRVDKARSRQSGGTGLGLSICHWIVESHGGRIEVESSVGEGSTFTVWLPLITSPMQEHPAP